ncbi:hypothetical protein MD535_08740 [Vibrio sp. ZSDZ65]|uniref:Uncharacterized protein n=1 Tax=Vibrio qingdaonensis TaxID=2829491 RepID=A0A9X3CMG1_9VIBR|nr:hypothetical protein [Vibrio qingdaonensis]MCW8346092.1 hypothetical protein [Vibrio qingdaonensis]
MSYEKLSRLIKPELGEKPHQLLAECLELKIPLYHLMPSNHSIWFGNNDECIENYNLSELITDKNKRMIIELTIGDIETFININQDCIDISTCSSIVPSSIYNSRETIEPYSIIKHHLEKEERLEVYKAENIKKISNGGFGYKFRVITEPKDKIPVEKSLTPTDIKISLMRKSNMEYYFLIFSANIHSNIYNKKLLSVKINDILIHKEDIVKLSQIEQVSKIPSTSYYWVPPSYHEHKELCTLAYIGYAIFEAGTIDMPNSSEEGKKLLKQLLNYSNEKQAIFAFILINTSLSHSVKRANKEQWEGRDKKEFIPQIKYLMKIESELTDWEKIDEITKLDFSDDYDDFALNYISNPS